MIHRNVENLYLWRLVVIKLICRDKSFVNEYKEYCQEFYDNKIITFVPTNPSRIDDTWFERTAEWYSRKERESFDGNQKGVHFWAIDNGKFIGEFQLRLELNDEIMFGIGSIGYSVRISEWGKGYGNEILKQGLDIARSYGLEKVLLNINDDNHSSIHICEKNGGVLMDKVMLESEEEGKHFVRRYWINLIETC